MLASHFFTTKQVRLHYVVGGNGRLPLLLLHGTTNRWQDFQPVLPYLQEQFQLYLLDLRGHGLSGRVANGYRVLDFAADVVAFLERAVGKTAVVWGHSLGGLVGIAAAAQAPHMVRGLVVEDSPLFLRRATVEAGSPRAYSFFRTVHQAMQLTTAEMETVLAASLPPERQAGLAALVERLPFVDPDVVRMSYDSRLMSGLDLDDCVRQIQCPTLLVQADVAAGGALGEDDLRAVLGLLKNGRFAHVPHAGHAIHAEQPQQMAQLVKEFAQQLMNF